ncbi:odorant receptor 4-like [Maniola hyperantus]|uniref:odorant receptor 4-like n=1 Tax=Aphantopus hyperantus TaxID=2795564 RepID=UPI0015695D90|nr:odorant receptor 4-like [Maniola hyperantus]
MEESTRKAAKQEIKESLKIVLYSMQHIGFSFDKPKNAAAYFLQKFILIISVCGICLHVFTELVYILFTFASTPSIEDVVPLLHIFGYGVLSIAKIFAFWYKKSVFGELVDELAEIWPMPPLCEDAENFKQKSLSALRISHRWYFSVNIMGVWFYILTPIIIYFHRVWQEQEAEIGFVWASWYPFDKHRPIAHVGCYLFEMYEGVTCVWIMVSSDLLFSGMASHIALLLRILQRRFESLASIEKSDDENFEEIRSNIKLHQRLISYCNSLEEAFSLVNLINIVMSSINICCVVFVIVLLEPVMAISNKLFLASILIQVGSMCWYADDILHANENISVAVYNSGWYKTSPRCRRTLLFIIRRSQKPIAFTAMKFTKISLKTYSSILTRSYSYFALLYTMYSEK